MNFKKLGIKVIIITVALIFLSKTFDIDPYVKVALGVFGIGSGLILLFLDGYRHFDP